MQLTDRVRKRIVLWYCVICLCIFMYRYFTNGLLSQIVPVSFINKIDFTTWIIQVTGLHKKLLNNFYLCLIADGIYFLFPFVYLFIFLSKRRFIKLAGLLLFVYSLIYSVVYCCYPIDSIETHIALMVFPIVLIPSSLQGFGLMFEAVRYFFLFFFSSAGIWKLVQGGLFNLQQMSGILLFQHKELLITDQSSLLLDFYRWLIVHPAISYWLYFLSTIMELFFIVGFFTKRYDRILLLIYCTFLIMDFVIMRIDYWRTFPFILCLIFSKYRLREDEHVNLSSTTTIDPIPTPYRV